MRFYRAHRNAIWLGSGCLIAIALLVVTVAVFTRGFADFIGLWRLGTAPFPVTVVDNRSSAPYVAQIEDYYSANGRLFIPVPANSLTAIDTVGHLNPATEHVWLWDAGCAARNQVAGDYSEGGTITIAPDGAISFTAKRTDRITPTELDSCQEAAAVMTATQR